MPPRNDLNASFLANLVGGIFTSRRGFEKKFKLNGDQTLSGHRSLEVLPLPDVLGGMLSQKL